MWFCYGISIDFAALEGMEYSKTTKANFRKAKLAMKELETRIPHCFPKADTHSAAEVE